MLRVLVSLSLAACAVGDDSLEAAEQDANVYPWRQPAKWPHSLETPRLIVHYQTTADLAMAQTVLADVEDAWTKQITQGGGRAPVDDGGEAGPDGRFDVYLDRGLDELYVAAVAANPATAYDDSSTAMVLDPWGKYGGAELRANVFHELRHASQGADDWNEHIQFFEAEATLWEAAYYGYARLPGVWADYQAHPEWTPFRDDGYRTWFMYGGALFLLYLRDDVFGGSLAWANQVWLASRNPAGTNEPDFVDALGGVLAARNTSLFDQLVAFARARWHTGEHANGTLSHGDEVPAVASRSHVRATNAQRTTFVAGPQLLGTIYTVVQKASTDGATARVSITSSAQAARAVVQLVGQGTGDRVLDLGAGAATVPYVDGKIVLAVTMLPANGAFDPDTVGTQTLKATIAIDR